VNLKKKLKWRSKSGNKNTINFQKSKQDLERQVWVMRNSRHTLIGLSRENAINTIHNEDHEFDSYQNETAILNSRKNSKK